MKGAATCLLPSRRWLGTLRLPGSLISSSAWWTPKSSWAHMLLPLSPLRAHSIRGWGTAPWRGCGELSSSIHYTVLDHADTPQPSPRSIVLTSWECWLLTAHSCPFILENSSLPISRDLTRGFLPLQGISQPNCLDDRRGQTEGQLPGGPLRGPIHAPEAPVGSE